jgi:hypothetical protein
VKNFVGKIFEGKFQWKIDENIIILRKNGRQIFDGNFGSKFLTGKSCHLNI